MSNTPRRTHECQFRLWKFNHTMPCHAMQYLILMHLVCRVCAMKPQWNCSKISYTIKFYYRFPKMECKMKATHLLWICVISNLNSCSAVCLKQCIFLLVTSLDSLCNHFGWWNRVVCMVCIQNVAVLITAPHIHRKMMMMIIYRTKVEKKWTHTKYRRILLETLTG